MTFKDQQLGVQSPHHATLDSNKQGAGGTVATFTLDQLTDYEFDCAHGDAGTTADTCKSADFSFRVYPQPTHSPEITCSGLAGVDTVTTMAPIAGLGGDENLLPQVISPPLPSVISPAPPPRVNANQACLAGGEAVVKDSVRNGDEQRWRISVRPANLWPTGYVYVIGLQGENMQVGQTVSDKPRHSPA